MPVLFAALLLGGCDSCGADESRAREREEDELLKGDPRAGDREAKPEPDEQALPNGGIELLPKTLPSRRAPPKKPAKGCKPGDPLCSDI